MDGLSQTEFSKDVVIKDVTINNAYRNGVSVISVENLLIDNATIINTGGTAPQAGIDFEPDVAKQRIVNATVRNSIIMANGSDGILWYVKEGNQARPVTGLIENVTIVGNSRFGLGMQKDGLPGFKIKDSLVINNGNSGFSVTGATAKTIEYSAFSGNGGSGATDGVASLGTGSITGTAPIFVSTDPRTLPNVAGQAAGSRNRTRDRHRFSWIGSIPYPIYT